MKFLKNISFVISLIVTVVSGVDQLLEELVYGSQKFTSDVYQELTKTQTGNFVFSPFSTFILLALLKGCAQNTTEREFQQALFLPDTNAKIDETILHLFARKDKPCNNLDSILVNKIYMSDRFEFDEEFQSVARLVYRTGFEKLNFTDYVRAAEYINSWVRDHTQHKISNVINPNDIDGHTKMALINALAFSSKWKVKFLHGKTKPERFFTLATGGDLEMDMMRSIQKVKYFHCPVVKAQYLLLEFENEDYFMEFVLPDYPLEEFGVIERRLERILRHTEFNEERVKIWLPKFSTTTEIDFIPILQNLGIKRIFEPQQAALTGISKDPDLHVDFILQKNYIDVREDGVFSEASLFSSVSSYLSALPFFTTKLQFKANHPFFYCLKEKSGIVLSAGRFVSPKDETPFSINN